MDVTVVGIFDSVTLAEKARTALLHAGVPIARIALDAGCDGTCRVGVRAQSSFERERIQDLLRGCGATHTERPAPRR